MCRQRAVISCLLDRFILNNYYARINSTIVIESSFKCFKMSVGIKKKSFVSIVNIKLMTKK